MCPLGRKMYYYKAVISKYISIYVTICNLAQWQKKICKNKKKKPPENMAFLNQTEED